VLLSQWLLLGLVVSLAISVLAVLALAAAGRPSDARALAGFIPDCLGLIKRLMGDPRVRGVAGSCSA
jgi:hypothetical protein